MSVRWFILICACAAALFCLSRQQPAAKTPDEQLCSLLQGSHIVPPSLLKVIRRDLCAESALVCIDQPYCGNESDLLALRLTQNAFSELPIETFDIDFCNGMTLIVTRSQMNRFRDSSNKFPDTVDTMVTRAVIENGTWGPESDPPKPSWAKPSSSLKLSDIVHNFQTAVHDASLRNAILSSHFVADSDLLSAQLNFPADKCASASVAKNYEGYHSQLVALQLADAAFKDFAIDRFEVRFKGNTTVWIDHGSLEAFHVMHEKDPAAVSRLVQVAHPSSSNITGPLVLP